MLSKEREEQVVKLCQRMIRQRSYSGEEEGAAKVLKENMEAMGFDQAAIDGYGNIIGCIKGKQPGKRLLFDGHIDTVPVSDEKEWPYPPFAAEIHDGKIYGRGTSDMKGAVAAMTCAAAAFAADTGKDFPGEIYVAGVVHEECFEGVAARAISQAVKPDYVVIGEASHLNLKVGQRGRGEIVVETFGVPCHSANPEKGVNEMCIRDSSSMLKIRRKRIMKKSLISVLMAMTVMAVAAGCSQGGDSATAAAEAKNETETKAAEESAEAEADSQSEETDGEEAKGEGSTFTVGFDADFPPMGFKAEDGSYTGFDLALAKEVADRLGMTFVAQPIACLLYTSPSSA